MTALQIEWLAASPVILGAIAVVAARVWPQPWTFLERVLVIVSVACFLVGLTAWGLGI